MDGDKNVLRCEMGRKRKLLLADGIQDGELVEFHDLWPAHEVLIESCNLEYSGNIKGTLSITIFVLT